MNVATWKARFVLAVSAAMSADLHGRNEYLADHDLWISCRWDNGSWAWSLERRPPMVAVEGSYLHLHGPVQHIISGRGPAIEGAWALVEEIEKRDRQEARQRKAGGA